MKGTLDIIIENSVEKFLKGFEGAKPLYYMTPQEARGVLEDVQKVPVEKPEVDLETIPLGNFKLHVFRPKTKGPHPVVVYYHGGGWILGSVEIYDRLMREICVKTGCAIVFVDYTKAPEANYSTILDQAYEALSYVQENGKKLNVNLDHLMVGGDSVGGNMAIAMNFLSQERKGPKIKRQVLYYPVTSAAMDTSSYKQFGEGPWLTKKNMEWFWKAYCPEAHKRSDYHLSPINASLDQLKNFPPTLIMTAENDVLRDEGEDFARRLMQAGVEVRTARFIGTIHDFVMLNGITKSQASRGGVQCGSNFFKKQFDSSI